MSMFGARDLALLLPDNIGEAQNFKTTEQLREEGENAYEAPKPKIDASKKTRRYFPGKTPDWIPEENEEITVTVDGRAATTVSSSSSSSLSTASGNDAVSAPVDRRLARLQKTGAGADAGGDKGGGRRRQRYEAEVVVEDSSPSPSSSSLPSRSRYETMTEGNVLEGDSALLQQLELRAEEEEQEKQQQAAEDENARRARIKAKLLAAAREEEELAAASRGPQKDGKGDEGESSEYETDTDSDDETSEEDTDRVMLKPVFIPRSRRETLREQEEKAAKAAAVKQQSALLKEESRKHETRVLVAESIRRMDEKQALDAQAATDVDSDCGMPDDEDLTDDDDEEYASWKLRELNRIKSEAERREALVQEGLELARRRSMTAEERLAEDTKLGKFREKEKKKWKYLQKYYHKGVFYMDDKSTGKEQVGTTVQASTSTNTSSTDYYGPSGTLTEQEKEAARKAAEKKLDARLRDYSGATLEDTYNREALPAVLQVKKFGMRGRTKYTHLVDQDTTAFGADAMAKDRNVQASYLQKRSGVGDIDTAGRRRKKQPRSDL